MNQNKPCKAPGCEKPAKTAGYCIAHYKRNKKYGDPLKGDTFRGAPRKHIEEVVLNYTGDECLIWPFSRLPNGYAKFHQPKGTRLVHRFVCEQVNGPPPTKRYEAAHICGQGSGGCVNPNHLKWATPEGNQADRVEHGTSNRGERQWMSKLTEQQARNIKASLKRGGEKSELARRYCVSYATILSIEAGRNWAWL